MWTCPKCGAKVDPSFEVCWQCGTSAEGVEDPGFLTADEAPPIEEPSVTALSDQAMASAVIDPKVELVECYSARDYLEAEFLADLLIEAGIPAFPDTFDLHETLGLMNATPSVRVPADRYAQAREILERFEREKTAAAPRTSAD